MPTYQVVDPKSGRKVRLSGDSAPTEQELEQIFSSLPEQKTPLGSVASDVGETVLNAAGEFAAGLNRTVINGVDFFTADQVNNILEIAGSDKRIPTLRDATDAMGATQGGFMEDGLAKDIASTAGETAGAALGFQGLLKHSARNLPAIQPAMESTAKGVLRTVSDSSLKQATTAGALSGTGAEVGEEVGGETGRLIGSVVAPAAPMLAKESAKAVTQKTLQMGEKGRAAIKGQLDDFAEIGDTPNLGQALKSDSIEGAQTISSKFLGGAPLRRKLDATREKIQRRLAKIADSISTVKGEEAAGRAIQQGIKGKGGFVDRFNNKSGVLWGRVDDAIGDDAEVALFNTRQTFDNLTNKGVFGEVLNNPLVSRLSDIAKGAGDKVAYSELKALRSQIGRKLSNNELVSDIPRAELKQLYGAITKDIKTIAAEKGALQQYTRANNFSRAGHKRIDDFVERIANKTDLEKIFNAVTKGGEGSQVVNSFKRSMKPEEWEVVVSNVIRKLGKPTAGNQQVSGDGFSVNSFVTQWNKLGKAKGALFSGSKQLNEYRTNLDRVARVAQSFKDDTVAQANPSGSGVFAANVGTAGGAAASLVAGEPVTAVSLISLVGLNNRAAALMANPRFVRWLAQSTKLSDTQIPAHIARLATVAEASDSTDILGFLDSIESSQEESQQQE